MCVPGNQFQKVEPAMRGDLRSPSAEPGFCGQSEFRIGVEIVWSVLVLSCIRCQERLRDRDRAQRCGWWSFLAENNRRKSICNRMLRRRPITVAEQNDGNVVIWKTVEFGGETWTVAFCRHEAVSKALPRVPAIAIVLAFDEVLLPRGALQQSIGVERAIEAIEVVDGRIQRTVPRFVGPVEIGRLLEPGDSGWVVSRKRRMG